ncbi:MAG: cytochrome c oxidase subunit I [Candidatus Sericytochromatia bacterium]
MATHTDVVSTPALLPEVGEAGMLGTRPIAPHGIWSWLTTVDHKRIGIMYGIAALFFIVVGGIEALLIRVQLAVPNNTFLVGDIYNQMFTMHGTTMIFLGVMPLTAAFFNYVVPLQIGARDVAFPRLNAFSLWVFIAGAILINMGWFLGGAPNGAWVGYPPITSLQYNVGHNSDFWVMGLVVLGTASVAASLNFFTTIINMRAPGMTMMRLPVFVWMTLITNILILLAFPPITIALVQLLMDRSFGANFFNPATGGMPIMWQHWFWVFGHPEVYILILPPMGIVSEILPTFSRKPLFGYPLIVFSGAFIGFMGFAVWSHHMFTTGMGVVAVLAFSVTTSIIAVPTGVKIFNWLGTMWGGNLRMETPMLYAVSFIAMFSIGGFSGIMHSAAAADYQQHDTYFIVAHFHYVLIGGAISGLLGGLSYWFPKITGRILNEKLGLAAFWTFFVGFNATFFPMHIVGLNGMPRRIYTYGADMGFNQWNLFISVSAFVLAFSFLLFFINMYYSAKRGEVAGNDPWDGRTLEWSIPSPPPVYNFAATPNVTHLDDFWHKKQTGQAMPDGGGQLIHMPGASYYPLVIGIGMFVMGMGSIYLRTSLIPAMVVSVGGFLVMLFGIYGWALEGPGGDMIDPKKESGAYN